MKRCVVISTYANNAYRKRLINDQIKVFRSMGIDVILASTDHIDKFDGVSNYVTAKNISTVRYLSTGLMAFFSTNEFNFRRYEEPNKFIYANYFIKLYQTAFNYAKHLGYDFAYFIDQDIILNEKHYDICFSKSLDTSKAYFYDVSDAYMLTFFYGNLNILAEMFSESNLYYLERLVKLKQIYNVESCVYELSKKNLDIIPLKFENSEIFYKNNLFSSSNVADIYYNESNKTYYFLMAKGDHYDSIFSSELYLDNNIIFSNTLRYFGSWNLVPLEHNKKYTIKYYDDVISTDTLSKTSTVYTDIDNISVPHRMSRI